ncbi:Uncharacterised protein [uncultured archaeon]|nr:Uncharacterised protein [uncultured archaeon]
MATNKYLGFEFYTDGVISVETVINKLKEFETLLISKLPTPTTIIEKGFTVSINIDNTVPKWFNQNKEHIMYRPLSYYTNEPDIIDSVLNIIAKSKNLRITGIGHGDVHDIHFYVKPILDSEVNQTFKECLANEVLKSISNMDKQTYLQQGKKVSFELDEESFVLAKNLINFKQINI